MSGRYIKTLKDFTLSWLIIVSHHDHVMQAKILSGITPYYGHNKNISSLLHRCNCCLSVFLIVTSNASFVYDSQKVGESAPDQIILS